MELYGSGQDFDCATQKSFSLPFRHTEFSLKSLLCAMASFWVIVFLAGEPIVQSKVLSALNQVFITFFYSVFG